MVNKLKELLFQNQGIRQTIAKNVFWLTTGQIGSRLLRALIIIYAARVLGATEYGVFAYVLGLAAFFTVFSDLGISSIMTREVARHPEEDNYYFITSFWIKIILLLLTVALIIFVAPYFSKIEAAKVILPLAALLIVFDGIRDFIAVFFRGKEKMEIEALLIAATNITITVVGFIMLHFSATAKALTTAYVLSAGAGTMVGIFIIRDKFAKLFKFFKRELVPRILKSSLPIALVTIISIIMLQTDILMIGFFKEAKDVGLYSVGQRVVQLLYLLPSIIAVSIFPTISRLTKKNDEKTKLIIEKGIIASMLIALPLALGGAILGESILKLLYGNEYLGGTISFQILIFTTLAVFPGSLIGNYILAYDQQKRMASFSIVGSVANVILNAIMIPVFGIVGAAAATLTSQIIYNSLTWRLAKKINNFFVIRHLGKIILAAIVMSIFAFIFDKVGVHIILNVFISALIYFGFLYLLKEETLHQIFTLVKK